MKETKDKKQSIKFILLTILIVAIIVFVIERILAYFTATKAVTNVFTIGNISIVLDEGTTWNEASANNSVPQLARNIAPEQEIEKSPNVINNGKNPAFIYLKVYVPVYKNQDLFTYTINTTSGDVGGWTQRANEVFHTTIDGQVFNIYTYQYDETLEAGKTTDKPLFSKVVFAHNMDFYPEDTDVEGQIKDIIIKAYGIQAEGGINKASNEITNIMTSDSNELAGVVIPTATTTQP